MLILNLGNPLSEKIEMMQLTQSESLFGFATQSPLPLLALSFRIHIEFRATTQRDAKGALNWRS
jgi:hypothetical protein